MSDNRTAVKTVLNWPSAAGKMGAAEFGFERGWPANALFRPPTVFVDFISGNKVKETSCRPRNRASHNRRRESGR
jgi:hypothetical protein